MREKLVAATQGVCAIADQTQWLSVGDFDARAPMVQGASVLRGFDERAP